MWFREAWLSDLSQLDKRVRGMPHLASAECNYYGFDTVGSLSWWQHLHPEVPERCEPREQLLVKADYEVFDGFAWTAWTSHSWHIPLIASAIYLAMLHWLKQFMRDRPAIRLQPVVTAWNFGLSLFSFAGVWLCVPRLLVGEHGLLTKGFDATVCAHPASYGAGYVGMFVAAFIYSKLAELIDTLWLVLRKSPVIFLHWYHHVTVLLYCWHSYSCRIATGLWFAAMNYSVHSIMYFYFGMTQLGPRGKALAKRFSMFITTMQLLQMVGGIVVTCASVVRHAQGHVCFVSLSNSFLGLLMYSSYFALFLRLFLAHYVRKPKADKNDLKPNDSKGAEAIKTA